MTLFFALRYFSLFKLSLFKQAAVSLSSVPCTVSHSKQAAMFSFRIYFSCCFSLTLVQEVSYFLWSIFPYQDIFFIRFFTCLVYIKPFVPINKQFSIDSFLDWEDHHWDFSLSRSSIIAHMFLPSLQLHHVEYLRKSDLRVLTFWNW